MATKAKIGRVAVVVISAVLIGGFVWLRAKEGRVAATPPSGAPATTTVSADAGREAPTATLYPPGRPMIMAGSKSMSPLIPVTAGTATGTAVVQANGDYALTPVSPQSSVVGQPAAPARAERMLMIGSKSAAIVTPQTLSNLQQQLVPTGPPATRPATQPRQPFSLEP